MRIWFPARFKLLQLVFGNPVKDLPEQIRCMFLIIMADVLAKHVIG